MNKILRKRMISLAICASVVLGSMSLVFADGARVVTLGANLSSEQKATMLKYFGVNENEVVLLEVNNQEERKYLENNNYTVSTPEALFMRIDKDKKLEELGLN